MTGTPSTLSILRDVANGKRRAFYPDQPVSAEAAAMFKDWLLEGPSAPSLDGFEFDFDSFVEIDADNLDLGEAGFKLRARNPWMRGGRRRKPTTEEQLQFLLVTLYLGPKNNLLRDCPRCKVIFLAGRSDKKYCSRGCKSRQLAGEHIMTMQAEIKADRIRLCKEGYAKYRDTKKPLTYTANYAHSRRPEKWSEQAWGKPITKNFVTHNFKEIGIREGELKEARKKEAKATKEGAR